MAHIVRCTQHPDQYEPVVGVPLRWEPNAPEAFLVTDDEGRAALAQRAHPSDPDQDCVVLRWDVVSYAVMSPPNDEARHHHRLYDLGLKEVDWVGIVRDSSLTSRLRPMLSSNVIFEPLHYVVVSKECVIEVLAENPDLLRVAGAPQEAAPASLKR